MPGGTLNVCEPVPSLPGPVEPVVVMLKEPRPPVKLKVPLPPSDVFLMVMVAGAAITLACIWCACAPEDVPAPVAETVTWYGEPLMLKAPPGTEPQSDSDAMCSPQAMTTV